MGPGKFSVAYFTFIRFFTIVNSSMSFQLLRGEERLVTNFACKSFFSQVNSFVMLYQVSLPCITRTTSHAQETLLSRMNTPMNLQLVLPNESFFTNFTNMWFDTKPM